MFKKVLLFVSLIFCTFISLNADASVKVHEYNHQCSYITNMTPEQIYILQYSYWMGEPSNLGETLAAIAWRESSAGVYLINYRDPSAGPYHVSARTALKFENIKDTYLNRNKILTKLVLSKEYAAKMALKVLNADGKRFNWNRFNMYASYNAGPNWKNKGYKVRKQATDYAQDVTNKVNLLIECSDYWMR